MKCMVYNLEDPKQKDFYLNVNGISVQGQCGVEINLKPEYIHVLENAIIDTSIRNPETNKAEPYRRERFKVVKLEPEPMPETGKKTKAA